MTNDLSDLAAISAARFQAEQARLRDILEEEKTLRARAEALEAQHRDAQSAYQPGQRSYGGDVLWQGWVGRARRQLQIELAQVLVRKGRMIRDLQQAHGRKLASETLQEDAWRAARKSRNQRRIEQEQSLFMIDRWTGTPED